MKASSKTFPKGMFLSRVSKAASFAEGIGFVGAQATYLSSENVFALLSILSFVPTFVVLV